MWDVAGDPPAGWNVERKRDYFNWTKQVIDQVRDVHPGLEAIFGQAYEKRV